MLNKTFVGKSEMLKQKVENPKTERTTDTKLDIKKRLRFYGQTKSF